MFSVAGKTQMTLMLLLFRNLFIQMINYQSPIINGDGSYSRDFTYIDSVIQINHLLAIIPHEEIIKKPGLNSRSFAEVSNIAHGERTDLNLLFEILKENLSKFDTTIATIEAVHGITRNGDIPHSLAFIEMFARCCLSQP